MSLVAGRLPTKIRLEVFLVCWVSSGRCAGCWMLAAGWLLDAGMHPFDFMPPVNGSMALPLGVGGT